MTESVSWKRYDNEHHLSAIFTEAARACVESKAQRPSEFLATYFAQVTKGDSVEEMECEVLHAPDGLVGIVVRLRLFTHAESTSYALPLLFMSDLTKPAPTSASATGGSTTPRPSPADEAALAATQPAFRHRLAHVLLKQVEARLLPELYNIGVFSQAQWDRTVESFHVDTPESDAEDASLLCQRLPTTFQWALSLCAASAAAKSASVPLYRHIRSHFLAIPAPQPPLGGAVIHPMHLPGEHFVMPRVLIPFFGRNLNTNVSPPGMVCVHTIYLIPSLAAHPIHVDEAAPMSSPSVEDGGSHGSTPSLPPEPINPKGLLAVTMIERLLEAARIFGERHNNPLLRSDGSFQYDAATDILDAINFAKEAVEAAGLVIGRDVSFGVRIASPFVRHNIDASGAPSSSAGAKTKKAAATQVKPEEVMYAFFSGDADVTGAQLAEYIKQQVEAANGLISFVEDSHDAQDVVGLHRMQHYIGEWAATSGRRLYDEADYAERIELGVKQSWSSNISINPGRVGTIHNFVALSKQLAYDHRSISLVLSGTERNAVETVDLAVGVGARYLNVGGLKSSAACAALSRLMTIQDRLVFSRLVADQPAESCFAISDLPPLAEIIIPEIKRKGDKKKKKGK